MLLASGESTAWRGDQLIACTLGAWRWLGANIPNPNGPGTIRVPAETLSPLPEYVPGSGMSG